MKLNVSVDLTSMIRLQDAINSPSSLIDRFIDHGRVFLRRGFVESKDPYGVSWKPVALSTPPRRRRRASRTDIRPLIDTGALRRSVRRARNTGTSAVFGPTPLYGSDHQEGVNQIKRAFFPENERLPQAWESTFTREIEHYITRALGGD